MFTTEFKAMGSRIFLAIDSDQDPWPEFREPVIRQFEAWEQSLSRFRSASELSEFNRLSGQWQQVSDPFWQVLSLALDVEKRTDGIVTPAVLDSLEAAGYNISFEDMGSTAGTWLRAPIGSKPSLDEIELDESTHSVKTPKSLRLDFGGVGKGWAAHQTMLMLQHIAPVLVDAGGDIAVSAPMRGGGAWPISVSDPINAEANLGLVMLTGGGVATSGRDYRRWQVNGRWQHHLIDPRIDAPAETDVLSATVIAPSVMEAEAMSKELLILGSGEAERKLIDNDDHAFLLVLEDGKTVESNHFDHFRWKESWSITQNQPSA